jgi:hypothetical protein
VSYTTEHSAKHPDSVRSTNGQAAAVETAIRWTLVYDCDNPVKEACKDITITADVST